MENMFGDLLLLFLVGMTVGYYIGRFENSNNNGSN